MRHERVSAVTQRLIGVDVGGTKISVAVLDGERLSEPVIQRTRVDGAQALVDQLVTAAQAAGPADAVGIGVPSVIDFETGTARTSVNIPLRGVPLRTLMAERLGTPAFVDNDATVAALAEAFDDDLRPVAQTLVMLTLGTGVGADAIDCLRILGERLGIGIANMVNTFDPDVVVIGGGVSRAGDLLLEPARRVAQGYILEGVGTRTEIRLARYGPQAGVRGAALLARQELEDGNHRKAG